MCDEYDYAGQRPGTYVPPRPQDIGGIYVTDGGFPNPAAWRGGMHPRNRNVYAPGYQEQGYLAPDARGALLPGDNQHEGFGPRAAANYGPRLRGLASRWPMLADPNGLYFDPRMMFAPKEGFAGGISDAMIIQVLLFIILVLTAMLICRPAAPTMLLARSPGVAQV